MKIISRSFAQLSLFCTLSVFSTLSIASSNNSVEMIAITNYQFVPSVVTVTPGTTVMWTNADSISHTVTAVDNSWNSGELSSGASYRHTFTKPGTYQYYCSIHPSMKGEVIVSASASASATSNS